MATSICVDSKFKMSADRLIKLITKFHRSNNEKTSRKLTKKINKQNIKCNKVIAKLRSSGYKCANCSSRAFPDSDIREFKINNENMWDIGDIVNSFCSEKCAREHTEKYGFNVTF